MHSPAGKVRDDEGVIASTRRRVRSPDYLKTANAALFLKENLTVLPMFIPTVLALVFRQRWVQWAAGLCYLATVLAYTILFCSTLS